MATSLTSDDCRSVAEANARFSAEKGLLVLRPRRSGGLLCGCCSAHFTVPSGCYALVTEHGADLDYCDEDEEDDGNGKGGRRGGGSAVWPPGLHYPHPPWVRVSHLVTQQSVVLDLPVKACRTKDNVTVNVDVALVFRIMGDASRGEDPSLVRKFVYEVKPRGLETQLRDAQEEAVRTLARSMRHTEIYGLRSGSSSSTTGAEGGDDEDVNRPRATSDLGLVAAEGTARRTMIGSDDDDDAEGVNVASFYTAQGSTRATSDLGFLGAEETARRTLMIEAGEGADEGGEVYEEESDFAEDDPLLGGSDIVDRRTASGATARGKQVTAAMRDRLNRQFVPQGVQILSVAIKQITLPDNIVSQMSERTMVVSQTAQQIMQHEYDMQNERMEQEVQTMLQTYKERRERETAAGKEAMSAERVRLDDAVSQATKVEAELREDADIKVQTIHAGNELVIQRIRNKIFKDTTKIESDSRKYCAELLADTNLEAQSVLSEAELKATENRAKADSILAEAEGRMAPWLDKKREHTTRLKSLKVYEQTAENGLILGTGTDDEEENLIAVADALLRREGSGDDRDEGEEEPGSYSRRVLMAEMALMNAASSALTSRTKED